LKLHEFGSIDWYENITTNELLYVMSAYGKLTPDEKVNVLRRSIIEGQDAYLAFSVNDKGFDKEKSGDKKGAATEYSNAVALDPHCLVALYNFADLLANLKDTKNSLKIVSKLLILYPENAMAWGLKAMCEEEQCCLEEATLSYETAYRIDKTSPIRLRNYAMLLITVKRYEKAKALYEELIALDSTNGVIIGEYADLLHTMDFKIDAIAAFEQALQTGKCNSTVVNDYAVLLHKIGMDTNNNVLLQRAKDLLAVIPTPNPIEEFNKMSVSSSLTCPMCGKEGTNACSKCKRVGYCSKVCQTAHWKVHKQLCKHLSNAYVNGK